jgi:hypothetical protein
MKPTGATFAFAVLLASAAGTMWFAFVRRVPEHTAVGTILSKGEMAGGTYVQQRSTQGGAATAPNLITTPPSNTFEIKLEGRDEPVYASFNTVKSRGFEPGRRVRVLYAIRGVPFVWQRVTVIDMTGADAR